MASLILTGPLEIATGTAAAGGTVQFTIDPSNPPPAPSSPVEIWERIVAFPPPGTVPTPPDFQKVGVFPGTTPMSKNVPLAALYQVRLYRELEGNKRGDGPVLAKLDFPCVLSEQGRSNFLTACARVPQVDITTGGTFASFAFAASKRTMTRVQLAKKDPLTGPTGLPSFPQEAVVASTLSDGDGPKNLHKMALIDERMLPGNKFFFVILVWDSNGNWDYVWNVSAAAPTAAPETITTKKRFVDVRLAKLYYIDDSDLSTNGEGDFTLAVQHKAQPAPPDTKKLSVGTFETGTSLPKNGDPVPAAGLIGLKFGPEVVQPGTRNVSVQVLGFDSDTGDVIIEDDDDSAGTAMTPLDFPAGEGKEDVTDRLLSLQGNPSGGDDTLRFAADILYSVKYN